METRLTQAQRAICHCFYRLGRFGQIRFSAQPTATGLSMASFLSVPVWGAYLSGVCLAAACLSGCNQTNSTDAKAKQAHDAKSVASVSHHQPALAKAASPNPSITFKVAAVPNLKFVLPILVNDFNQTHPQVNIQLTFDTAVNLYDDITSKKQNYDVFLSSNEIFPKLIYEEGKRLNPTTPKYAQPFTFARGQLVLYSKNYPLEVTPTSTLSNFSLAHPNAKIALANPQVASYGMAAENWLINQNLSNEVSQDIIYQPTVDDVFTTVEKNEADFGFVALAQVINKQHNPIGQSTDILKYAILPKDSYPPILQNGIVLNPSPTSEQFVAYLLTAKAQDIMTDAGYLPVCQSSNLLPACK